MIFSEKIQFYRKKAGLSQEGLAEQIGVSRQAISKWETGDAQPDLNNLYALSKALGVSADELLSFDPPETEQSTSETTSAIPNSEYTGYSAAQKADWVENLPHWLGSIVRRYGWLAGVYAALCGCGFTAFGLVARSVVKRMFGIYPDELMMADPAFAEMIDSITVNNPIWLVGNVAIVVGLVIAAAGVILAIWLKKRSRQ